MTTTQHVPSGSLTQGDLERIERLIFKNGDDLAVSVARALERLEERIDGVDTRIYSRLADIEDQITGACKCAALAGRKASKASPRRVGVSN